jgi:hypothetical protein
MLLAMVVCSALSFTPPPIVTRVASRRDLTSVSRRDALRFVGVGALTAATPAVAFDNAIGEYANYADKPKRPGNPPKDLGTAQRSINVNSIEADPETFLGLRGCDGKPNCFSTTGDSLLSDRILTGVDTLIPPWKPPQVAGPGCQGVPARPILHRRRRLQGGQRNGHIPLPSV